MLESAHIWCVYPLISKQVGKSLIVESVCAIKSNSSHFIFLQPELFSAFPQCYKPSLYVQIAYIFCIAPLVEISKNVWSDWSTCNEEKEETLSTFCCYFLVESVAFSLQIVFQIASYWQTSFR